MASADVLDRSALRRVLAVANGKGGVGKTSTTTHLGGQTAAAGRRVLLIDLDPQGNAAEDLGYTDGDGGRGLVHAVMVDTPLFILRDVRERLDVIPGGPELEKLADHLHSAQHRQHRGENALEVLARVIAGVADGYDLILIDCPPANNAVLQEAAMDAAQYLLVPTHSDKSSRNGLVQMARRFTEVRSTTNPTLKLLGVLLFGITSSASIVRESARKWIDEALDGQAPVFTSTIRHVEAAAFDIRERGMLAHELAASGHKGSTAALAGDYYDMAHEALARLVQLEQAAA